MSKKDKSIESYIRVGADIKVILHLLRMLECDMAKLEPVSEYSKIARIADRLDKIRCKLDDDVCLFYDHVADVHKVFYGLIEQNPCTWIEQAVLDDVKDLIRRNFPFAALPEDEGK